MSKSARELDLRGLGVSTDVRAWGNRVRQTLIGSAQDWETTDEYLVLRERDSLWRRAPRNGGFDADVLAPALSIPVDAKSDFSMPAEHLSRLRESLGSVRTVMAIGWRATEAHFLSVLASCLPQPLPVWHLVSPRFETTEEVASRLGKARTGSHFESHTMGFSDFLDTQALADALGE